MPPMTTRPGGTTRARTTGRPMTTGRPITTLPAGTTVAPSALPTGAGATTIPPSINIDEDLIFGKISPHSTSTENKTDSVLYNATVPQEETRLPYALPLSTTSTDSSTTGQNISTYTPTAVETTNSGNTQTTSVNSQSTGCLLYTSPSPRDGLLSRMPSSA